MWSTLFPSRKKSLAETVAAFRSVVRRSHESSPVDVTHGGSAASTAAAAAAPVPDALRAEASKHVVALKAALFGHLAAEVPPKPEDVALLTAEAVDGDLLALLARHLRLLEFEASKDAVLVFNNLLRRSAGGRTAVARVDADGVLETLVGGYEVNSLALNCGSMLRECLRHEPLVRALLWSPLFWRFFSLVGVADFDVASDAFLSFKEALTRHKAVITAFMADRLDPFVSAYNGLLSSKNYVVRRQSLKLLGEMLVERSNFGLMTHYIASADNLKLIMNLLLDSRRNIQFEAFHVFKVFVANPNKTPPVATILAKNRDRLLSYLADFLTDRDDEQFHEERLMIMDEIRGLGP